MSVHICDMAVSIHNPRDDFLMGNYYSFPEREAREVGVFMKRLNLERMGASCFFFSMGNKRKWD